MEIHPPHGSIHSWKDFLIQIGTITVGVLIALSFEGVREWRHERALVREAREKITHEIADNLKEVEGEEASVKKRQENVDGLLTLVDKIKAKKAEPVHEVTVGTSLADLSAAGWQTAERMGALAHMEYAEVQRYSKLYGLQQLFVDLQRRTLDHAVAAMNMLSGSPFDASPSELEAFQDRLRQLRADLLVEEQIGQQLRDEYRKTLH